MKKFLYSIFIFFLSLHIAFAQTVRLDVAGDAKIVGDLELADADSSLHIGIKAGAMDGAKGNTFIGTESGSVNTTGSSNTFLGHSAGLTNMTGSGNTFLGEDAGGSNTIGGSNTFVGENAGKGNIDNGSNTYIGNNAGATSFGGNKNTFIGQDAGFGNTLGDLNTFVGENAGKGNTSGDNNTFIGQNSATASQTGDNNTALGATVNFTSTGLLNSTALGYATVMDASNKAVVGNIAVNTIGGFSSWTTFPSDGRMKSRVKENVGGLDFILQLRPVTYTVDALKLAKSLYPAPADTVLTGPFLKAIKEKSRKVQTGFIAQEVAIAAKKNKYNFSGVVPPTTPNGTYGLNYAEFTVPIVKAVQEFHQDYENLKEDFQEVVAQNEALQTEVAELRNMIKDIQAQLKGGQIPGGTVPTEQYLKTNAPNPFNQETTIEFFVPAQTQNAQLHISTIDGKILKTINIQQKGKGQIQFQKANLPGGTYIYTLKLDGKVVAGKKMMIQY